MPGATRKMLLPPLAALALLALGGCGSSHTKVAGGTYAGESGANAPYLDVGPLTYEVQLSRQLNPYDTEDEAYLRGLTPAQRTLAPNQEWFGVFIQVYNHDSRSHPASNDLTITDTQSNHYVPITPDLTNEFVYRGGLVPGKGRLPALDSVAANGATQGALLLYKIQIASLSNRPLTFKIIDRSAPGAFASAELDV